MLPHKEKKNAHLKICHIYCGAERFGKSNPFRIKPKAHAEKKEMSEDEQRRPKVAVGLR